MKTIVIGDIHGKDDWKKILREHEWDKIVFLGDYFDSFTHSGKQQIDNFNEILAVKRANPNDITLLIGNHDLHYVINESYSGFQKVYQFDIKELLLPLLKNKEIQVYTIIDDYLLSHAGITYTYLKNNDIKLEDLNEHFYISPTILRFQPGDEYNVYGDEVCQSPVWVRPKSLLADYITDYKYIVGHTRQDQITKVGNVWFIDCLDSSKEYLLLENNIVKAVKI